jgi:hypothetical protein
MLSQRAFTVPSEVTFEQAIALSQSLLAEIEQGQLSATAIEAAIAALVTSPPGARGWFVTYLTGDYRLADQPSEAVITALRSQPEPVADLLVKNLAMSTAMIITHTHNQQLDLAAGSAQVQRRTQHLIQLLQLDAVAIRLQTFLAALKTETGSDQAFLTRWGYDTEQRAAIHHALSECAATAP